MIRKLRSYTKICFLLAGLVLSVPAHSQYGAAASNKYTLNIPKTSLHQVLQQIQQQTGINIIYSDALVRGKKSACICKDKSIEKILEIVLRQSNLDYQLNRAGHIVLFQSPEITFADLQGYVFDRKTGEPLPYANVYLNSARRGTSTNRDGYFVMVDAPDTAGSLIIDYLGYQSEKVKLAGTNFPGLLIVKLRSSVYRGDDITIYDEDWELIKVGLGASQVRFSPEQLAYIPTVHQEDVFRALQLLPGLNTFSDGSSELYIRGGTPDQNLVLFDGMTIFQVDHFFGFLSPFSANAIKDIRVYKSGYPAKYGGRTSGVIDLTGKSGNADQHRAGLTFDLLSSRAYAAIPIYNSGALLLSGRRSYSEILQSPIYNEIINIFIRQQNLSRSQSNSAIGYQLSPDMYFYDVNAKLNLQLGKQDLLSLSFYNSKDDLDIRQDFFNRNNNNDLLLNLGETFDWYNIGTSLKWSRIWQPRFYSNLLVSWSRFKNDYITNQRFASQVVNARDYTFQAFNQVANTRINLDNEWHLNKSHTLGFGASIDRSDIFYRQYQDQAEEFTIDTRAFNSAVYFQDHWQRKNWDITLGARAVYYDKSRSFFLEPRTALGLQLADFWRIKGSWGHFHQFVKNIDNEQVVQKTQDFWILADKSSPAQFSEHFVLGNTFENRDFLLDVELYYKTMDHLGELSLRYRDDFESRQDLFFDGSGISKGIEFLLQKKSGRLTGWTSYVLSKVEHQFDDINNANAFAAEQDRRHEFKILGNLNAGNWHLSANWIVASGKPSTTLESQYYITLINGTVQRYFDLGNKSGDRLPPYHRLDVSLSRDFHNNLFDWKLGLSIFNLYNRDNIWYRKFNVLTTPVSERNVSMLGITPNAFVKIEFN